MIWGREQIWLSLWEANSFLKECKCDSSIGPGDGADSSPDRYSFPCHIDWQWPCAVWMKMHLEERQSPKAREWGKCELPGVRVIWICGLVLWAKKGWRTAPGSAWNTFHFSLLCRPLCSRRFSSDSDHGYESYAFPKDNIHTNNRERWQVHLQLFTYTSVAGTSITRLLSC